MDEDTVEQDLHLGRALRDDLAIGGEVRHAHLGHPAPDAPDDAGALVAAEVDAAEGMQQSQDRLQLRNLLDRQRRLRLRVDVGVVRSGRRLFGGSCSGRLVRLAGDQCMGDALRREGGIHSAGEHRAPRHPVVGGRDEILRVRAAAGRFDGLESCRAVGAVPREHDADGALAPRLGQRGEAGVDDGRRALARRPGAQAYVAVDDLQHPVGREDVQPVGLEPIVGGGELHREPRDPRHELGQLARVRRREMGNEQVREPGALGQCREQPAERLQPARGRADAHDSGRLHDDGDWVSDHRPASREAQGNISGASRRQPCDAGPR